MRNLFNMLSSLRGPKYAKPIQEDENIAKHVTVITAVSFEAGDAKSLSTSAKPSLEYLPTEIQSAVLLNIRDIASLRNLIHASPTLHNVYLSQRYAILKRVLFNSVHPDVLHDAFSAITSSKTRTRDAEDRVVRVKAFLLAYDENRDEWTLPEHLDLESIARLARLQKQVQHATEDFCQTAFATHPFTGERPGQREQLSSNECRRLHRAFYRFEIFCNLFRDWDQEHDVVLIDDVDSTGQKDTRDISTRFFSLFLPWEIEELACVRDFFHHYYRRMIHHFEPDLRERNPNHDFSDDGNGSCFLHKIYAEG